MTYLKITSWVIKVGILAKFFLRSHIITKTKLCKLGKTNQINEILVINVFFIADLEGGTFITVVVIFDINLVMVIT